MGPGAPMPIDRDIAPTLITGQRPAVCYKVNFGEAEETHVCPTLTCGCHNGLSRNQEAFGIIQPLCLAANTLNRSPQSGGNGLGVNEGVSFTLTAEGPHSVHYNDIIRKLTPLECERLTGLPDNYTCIPYRGRPAEHCPDLPRYIACGNAWAVNCARWVLLRLQAYLTGTLPTDV